MSTSDPEERPLLTHRSLGHSTEDGTHSFEDHETLTGGVSRAQLERSLLHKLDRRMAARLRGFEEDLHLEGNQFASILSILYVGYILMQIPSFFGALCTRFFLGFVEAAFFPGALFLISKWYKKNELSKRTAYLYCGNLISNAIGTLLASAILDTMDGVLGFAAWRWLFFVEGSFTVIVAVIAIFVLPDFPESPCSWLTPAERALAMQRMMEDVGQETETPSDETNVTIAEEASQAEVIKSTNETTQGLQLALADWKVWWLAMSIGHHPSCSDPPPPSIPSLGIGALQMNSLTYLSRQFDVLASAKTPPSTPTSDRSSFIGDRHGKEQASGSELHRTWSTKSFLLPPSSDATSSGPKRSFSSPAFVSLRKLGLKPSISSTTSPDVEIQPRSKPQVELIVRRIFFIRVFALVWENLRAAWQSFWRQWRVDQQPISISTVDQLVENKESPTEEIILQPPSLSQISSPPAPSISSVVISDSIQLTSTEPPFPPSYPHPTLIRASESPLSVSRSTTPLSAAKKSPFHLPKTLVLDLDETLIHSTSRPMHSTGGGGFFGLGSFSRNKGASHMVEVVLGGRSTLYHVYKRPFVDFFLRTVSGWYTLVIFTASMQEYADPVIDWLDAGRGILSHRFFRDSCTQLPNGSFTKDLTLIESDLARVCLVDNSPVSYRVNEANGIPIEGWTHDPSDEALLDLLPVLDSLRFTSDVRRVLGLRTAGGRS
ncbi:hypothetical protein H0H92_003415 [Tricholoma furcatifolium]|nr:hypothetical protein H0H92_003415 [Tricholoma furcatifolium]